ncbi:uncharacterized protein N7498_008816 [Penicillium cinerascens]|uniref:Ubiquitin-like domain-containing protein n=1 Tax=Penicillium cinerascens TaxID=70096 RepID=A0A9W9JEH1_9EURO|nr:uncharacterized protein N7498_008816 [Penicillium cinerascens]KAJ5195378.1 hypothetical protein N7498_008816 [Penicillium cinerascens]
MASPALLSPYGTVASDPVADALLIIVRFSASIPDLPLDVPTPETTTGAGLKQLIRAELPSTLSSHRLRLIYSGRGLEDATALATSLKLPPSPSRTPHPEEQDETESPNGKGKKPVRDTRSRIYIHCSIGDIALPETDLAAEAAMASTLLVQKQKQAPSTLRSSITRASPPPPPATTTPAPRGFDRLLSAGFTAAEVTALRSQFLAVQSVSRTPDTMPTGEELRDLEDRWMDEGSTAALAQAGGEGGSDDEGGFGSGSRSAMDDMLLGGGDGVLLAYRVCYVVEEGGGGLELEERSCGFRGRRRQCGFWWHEDYELVPLDGRGRFGFGMAFSFWLHCEIPH